MKEIKFACPKCGQHIACDRDYAGLCIVCPACSQPMEVPRLGTAEAARPQARIVASIPTPRQRLVSRIPGIDLWTENEWEEHRRATATQTQPTPAWLVCALGTVVFAAVLRAARAPGWAIVLCVVAGTALSCYLAAKKGTIANTSGVSTTVAGLINLMLWLIIGIPALAVGVIFIGCALL